MIFSYQWLEKCWQFVGTLPTFIQQTVFVYYSINLVERILAICWQFVGTLPTFLQHPYISITAI
jgi:hypothetical protein